MRRWLGLSSVMMSNLEKGDGDLSEGSFGRWGPSRVFLQAVNVFLHGERFRPTPPHSGYLAIDCKWFIQLLLMAKHRLDFNLRPGALSWITGSEVSWLLGRTPEVE